MFFLASHDFLTSKFFLKDIKDMNKNVLGVLKKMANNHNVRKTEIWMESEMQMVSILNRSRRKQKVDDHFKNARMVNDFCTGIHSWVSGFSNLPFQKSIFPGKPNRLFYLLLE